MTPTFRSIGELAERCGHYCWLEHRLFIVTGMWATAPPASGIEAEIRVLCSEMSSWHGFVAAQWKARLPVRAGVNAETLIVPSPGPLSQALERLEGDLLKGDAGFGGAEGTPRTERARHAWGQMVEHILPALLEAYDEDFARASPVAEAPVRALLGLIRPRVHLEIARGRMLLDHA